MPPLFERYRPATLAEVAGNEKVKARVGAWIESGQVGGRAVWVSGVSGAGKTTVARILAACVASRLDIVEVDAGRVMPSEVEEWEHKSGFLSLFGTGGHAFILNEAHRLRADTITALLVALERIPDNCLWVFTTTTAAQLALFDSKVDAQPLLDRCDRLKLEADQEAFARRAQWVAEKEGLGGAGLSRFRLAVAEASGSLRQVLQRVDAGEFAI